MLPLRPPETKAAAPLSASADGTAVWGYASLWGIPDRGGDIVERGAFAASLRRLRERGEGVRMLWQHDPAQPIGLWDEVEEDATGLRVKGRLLPEIARAREAMALVAARALDGLSIGYRTLRAARDDGGRRRLREVELWEVSLVTFPMLPGARLAAKSAEAALLGDLSAHCAALRARLRRA
ncbi:HK97 family phage prohead protease [Rubellimicrobium sp. CFH 75288]|uniref:HK97 family phage prohead protease n=1 Tax=Rubellimicrobium sp. CFH 75288 TaxID=2697034 RepID=UPI001412816C|nr:HK97 family phage prohead protease [Rubellimicrobium sp. CFH 75288]NAZ35524.1 HK97 family phage prohead protease [Rubellimicrobium sp. CFH 75288]